ncbi:hypothetical protein EYC84_000868 [Monilinia fructicola]|uniref:Peptidase M12B domain-containing protein n=1 Tax=Monilinia fructicola TaxID=38448 RepID=A0A5M9JMI2_MONFR|nr:hypothetical protein EYC84_000868 [Monilinia fructicola]
MKERNTWLYGGTLMCGSGYTEDYEGLMHPDLRRSAREDPSCSADGLNFNSANNPINNYEPMGKRNEGFWGSISTRAIFGRQIDTQSGGNSAGVNLITTIGSSAGCPSTRKVALVGSQLCFGTQYEDSFNITLGLQNLTVSDAACPATAASSAPWNVGCSDSVSIQDRLNLFSAWRGERPDTNAYWTLLSTCGTGSAVGLAWLGQACVTDAQVATTSSGNETVSGANVVVRTSTEWQVLAHETGHTFGAVHDCTAETCSDGQTVAAQQCCPLNAQTWPTKMLLRLPEVNVEMESWNPGKIVIAVGLAVAAAIVAVIQQHANLRQTQFVILAMRIVVHRLASLHPMVQYAVLALVSATPQEVCSGTAATCPVDATAPDGTSCGNSSSLSCASGQCTSRDLQCKTIMGSYTTGNDTYACSSSGCQISCASPEFGANVCYSMQQNFLDGTSCQGGGKCLNGDCKGASVGKEITSWIDEHRNLVIGIASAIGALVIFALLSCIVGRVRRRNAIRRAKERAIYHPQGYNQGPAMWQPPPMSGARGMNPDGGTWVDGRWRQAPQHPRGPGNQMLGMPEPASVVVILSTGGYWSWCTLCIHVTWCFGSNWAFGIGFH